MAKYDGVCLITVVIFDLTSRKKIILVAVRHISKEDHEYWVDSTYSELHTHREFVLVCAVVVGCEETLVTDGFLEQVNTPMVTATGLWNK